MFEKAAEIFTEGSPTAATPAELLDWCKTGTPITMCEVDGPGALGKSALFGILLRAVRHLPSDGLDNIYLYSSQEPPNWPEVAEKGAITPYEYVRQNLDCVSLEDMINYILWIRTGRWHGISIDGLPLNYPADMLRNPNAILFQDRGNLSTVAYNGAGVLGIDPWEKEGGAFHAHSAQDREIPFPTVLGVMIPDNLTSQIRRLKRRIELDHGELVDKGDAPGLQKTLYLRYLSFLDWAHDWPGVYKIISAEADPEIFLPTGFSGLTCLSLLTYAIAVERGANHKICDSTYFGTCIATHTHQNIFRVETPNQITAYLFPGYLNIFFNMYLSSLENYDWNPMHSGKSSLELAFIKMLSSGTSWGDIGLFARMKRGIADLIVVATENRTICPIAEAARVAKLACERDLLTPVTPNTRKGSDFWSEYPVERRWRNVTRIPITPDI